MTDEALTVQDAQAMLEADRQRRSEAAGAAIRAVLEQYGCDIVPLPQITPDGHLSAVAHVVAR